MSGFDERAPLLNSRGSPHDDAAQTQAQAYCRYTSDDVTVVTGRKDSTHSGVTGNSKTHSVDKEHAITMSWRDLNVSVRVPGKSKGCCGRGEVVLPSEKHILKDVSGVVEPGSLLAIMGASGAGKSTLLNVLTSRNTKNYIFTGDIRLNGWHIGDGIKNISAYVQQDDLFISMLTVREQLQFRALLRMDKRLTKQARLARVEEVISEMGLTSCADSRIGNVGGGKKGISGGERKRLSFASEALTNPPIFFCDEPTSGLDTFMAQNIVHTLQTMASRGRVILCTIHQPSSELYAMFNQILLLAEGRTAYMGNPAGAIEFFERMQYPCPRNFNPADHFILTLAIMPGKEEECRSRTHAICDVFNDSPECGQMINKTDKLVERARDAREEDMLQEVFNGEFRYQTPWFTQFRYLFWRSWISLFRDVMLFRVRISQTFVVAIILGLVYLQLTVDQKGVMNINGAIFLLIVNTSFSNMFAVLNSFPLEITVFLREYGTGLYRADSYYLAKSIAEVPLFVVISVIFSTVTYWMIGLYASWDAYLIFVGILLLTANVAISLAYFISTLTGSVTISLAIAPPLLIPFMLFGGLFVNNGNIPVYFVWMEYLSWFKYSNEILMVNQWKNVDNITCNDSGSISTAMPPMARCQYETGEDVLRYTSFDQDNVTRDIGLLIALQVGLRVLSLIALVVKARRSKE